MRSFYDILRLQHGVAKLKDQKQLPSDIAELELRYLHRLFCRRDRQRRFPPLLDCCRMLPHDRDND
jgi:hypothetical protein